MTIETNNSAAGPRIAALGDSITYGYPDGRSWTELLAKELSLNVHNAGINGDTLEGMLFRLESDVLAYAPDICILMGGSNDVAQGYPLKEMQANATKIKERLEQASIRVLFGVPIPIAVMPAFETQLQAYRTWLDKIADHKIPFHECFLQEGQIRRGLLSDGVHPTYQGYQLMAEVAIKYIRELL